jgi:hypothetical protein
MSNLATLMKFFVEMCMLRKDPQALPNSLFLLQFLALTNLIVTLVVNIATMPFSTALILALLALLLVYCFTVLVLQSFNFGARLRQTLIAIFGTDLIFAAPAIALRYWSHSLEASGQQSDLAIILWLAVFMWNLIVVAHIIRHALSKPFGVGVFISIAYTVIIFNILSRTHTWLGAQI